MNASGASVRNVVVGMSGGVDSTLCAWLLLRQGYQVTGVTMRTWQGTGSTDETPVQRTGCYGPGEAHDIEAAAQAAHRLGITHHVLDLTADYQRDVLAYFRSEYQAGRTPNPCVRCNRTVKFGALLDHVRSAGIPFDRFATGHYARVERMNGGHHPSLFRGVDRFKDQSYFLCRLTADQLSQVMFPLGTLTKTETRELARSAGLGDYADKPESQDFIDRGQESLLFEASDAHPGPIEMPDGRQIGEHRGIIHYTIGQRKGLGLSGTSEPLYVIRIDTCRNALIVGPQASLQSRSLESHDMHWIEPPAPGCQPLRVHAQIRQQHAAAPAVVTWRDPACPTRITITFDDPQLAITPGQTVACYEGDRVLGGGTIEIPAG